MANITDSLKELNLTRDEVERFEEALKKKEFRKMLIDYVEEIQSPENQKLYEQEITELERRRGVDVTFVKPNAGYVIKTSADGDKKVFINICSNDIIDKPSSSPSVEDGCKGFHWQIPHTMTPPRDDVDNKGRICKVYDVVFHTESLNIAQNNKQFRQMLNNIACEAVESNFKVKLDRKNLKFPKVEYKGRPYSAVIRKPSTKPSEMNQEDKEFVEKLMTEGGCPYKPPSAMTQPKTVNTASKTKSESKYTTPKYIIKHRSHVEMEQFAEHKASKMNSAIPKELIVEVNLPLLKSASDVVLDVNERTIQLTSEKPAKYKLDLRLPYEINENLGNAKFDKDQKKLIITLPVKRNVGVDFTEFCREDSGIESDHGSLISSSPVEETESETRKTVIELDTKESSESERTNCEEMEGNPEEVFLDPSAHYMLPDFSCHVFENIFAFTLHVKNVTETSVHKHFNVDAQAVHLKFASISSGFFPIHYAFYFKLPDGTLDFDNVSSEVWDNNVIVQIPVKCDKKVNSFFVGIDESSLQERYIDDPSVINKVFQDKLKKNNNTCEKQIENLQNETCLNNDFSNKTAEHLSTDQSEDEIVKEKQRKEIKKDKRKSKSKSKQVILKTAELSPDKKNSKSPSEEGNETENAFSNAIDIVGCESSGDELSCSYSPRNKGILKNLSHIGRPVSRSMSESSIDDVGWTSSVENCHNIDSAIPEEEHVSTSLKKTVRFNDVVSKQVFSYGAPL